MRPTIRAIGPTAAAALCLLLSLAQVSDAGTVTYDFNDGTLDGLAVTSQTTGYSYNVSGGTLNVQATAGTGNGNVAFQTPFSVSGDFTATVDVTRTNLATGGDLVLELLLGGSNFADAYESGPSNLFSNITEPTYTDVAANDSTQAVELKIQRIGDTLTTAYSGNGGATYTLMQSRSDASYTASSPFTIFFDQELGNTAAQSGYFDNLSITSDSISAAPLPSSGLGGIALLLLVWFGRGSLKAAKFSQANRG